MSYLFKLKSHPEAFIKDGTLIKRKSLNVLHMSNKIGQIAKYSKNCNFCRLSE